MFQEVLRTIATLIMPTLNMGSQEWRHCNLNQIRAFEETLVLFRNLISHLWRDQLLELDDWKALNWFFRFLFFLLFWLRNGCRMFSYFYFLNSKKMISNQFACIAHF